MASGVCTVFFSEFLKVDYQLHFIETDCYEIKFGEDKVPPRAAVNEAVELAKHFGSDESGRFVNGILGSLVRGMPE